ncbi:MAG: ABC transporter ATP-binding protein, partial [Phycisphaerae bacterium]|nr:ABC transporter ATP-binding protein [Phycisphaerae bacterium]
RAILRDPAILIFDEALSQVDPESERKIHLALEEFLAGRTTILIAHRFATIRQAARIAVMEAGGIIDVGTHSELLSRCPLYDQLCRTQFVALGPD